MVKAAPAYQRIIDWVLSLNIDLLVLAVLTTCIVCGIAGGPSSGSLDTLPHSSGLFLVYDMPGLNHKNAYRHSFAASVAIPMCVTVVATVIRLLLNHSPGEWFSLYG